MQIDFSMLYKTQRKLKIRNKIFWILPDAGHQMDIHREINDSGGHENIALGFLKNMKPVSESYASEALFFAELATLVIHQVSAQTLKHIKQ